MGKFVSFNVLIEFVCLFRTTFCVCYLTPHSWSRKQHYILIYGSLVNLTSFGIVVGTWSRLTHTTRISRLDFFVLCRLGINVGIFWYRTMRMISMVLCSGN